MSNWSPTRPRFVERPRLHQLATGQKLRDLPLNELLAGTAVRLRVGRASAINRAVSLRSPSLPRTARKPVMYDTLVYALGQHDPPRLGARNPTTARALTGPDASDRLRSDLTRLPAQAAVLVCGGGLTGIETAAEIADSFPELRVRLVTAGRPGDWLSPAGQRYLASSFERLGVAVSDNAPRRRGDGTPAAAGRRPRAAVSTSVSGPGASPCPPWPPTPVWRSTRGTGS